MFHNFKPVPATALITSGKTVLTQFSLHPDPTFYTGFKRMQVNTERMERGKYHSRLITEIVTRGFISLLFLTSSR